MYLQRTLEALKQTHLYPDTSFYIEHCKDFHRYITFLSNQTTTTLSLT